MEIFSPELATRPQILAANKCDVGYDEETLERIKAYAEENGYSLYLISAATREGVQELLNGISASLRELPPVKVYEPEEPAEEIAPEGRNTEVTKDGDVYVVTGEWLKKVCGSVNFDDYESLAYFQRVLRNGGVIDALEKAGIQEGDTVDIYGIEFDFVY